MRTIIGENIGTELVASAVDRKETEKFIKLELLENSTKQINTSLPAAADERVS